MKSVISTEFRQDWNSTGSYQSFVGFLVFSPQTSLFPVYAKSKNDVLKMVLPLELSVGIIISPHQNKNLTTYIKTHILVLSKWRCDELIILLTTYSPLPTILPLSEALITKATQLQNLSWHYSSPSSFMLIEYLKLFPTSGPLHVLVFPVG